MKNIQLVGIAVGFYLLLQTFLNYRRGNYSLRRTLFFSGLWALLEVLFIYPPLAELALPFLSTEYMIQTVLVIGVVVTFVLISQVYQQIGRLENRVEKLVQNLAIGDYLEKVSEDKDDEG